MVMTVRKTTQHAGADVFTAIAHPVRRQILDALAEGDLSVTRLADPFKPITRSAISQHLGILLESGLVEMEKRGRENYYRLRPDNLNEVRRWMQKYDRFWTKKLNALDDYLDTMEDDAE
jgi:DNA-binding transcriptional ArsR family regulator